MKNRMPSHRSVGPLLAVVVLAVLMAGSRADSLFAGSRSKPLDVQQLCPTECQAAAEAAKTACLQRGESLVNCQAEADTLLQVCLQFRCGISPGGVPVTAPCDTQCSDAAKQIYDRCLDIEQQPVEVCEARYSAFLAACQSRVCNPTTPTPTRTPSCAERCNESGATYYDSCVASGVAPDLCAQQAQAAVAACLAGNCSTAPITVTLTTTPTATSKPTIDPGSTVTPTLATGGTVTPTVTTTPTLAVTPTLTATATKVPTSVPSATIAPNPTLTACLATCVARALQAYNECLVAGGDEALCRTKQQNALNTCSASCGAGTPTVVANRTATRTPVPLSTCKQSCINQANLFLHQCVGAGRSQDVCQVEAQSMLEQCSRNCNQGTAPPPVLPSPSATPTFGSIDECNAACNAATEAFYKRCLNNGGSLSFCQQQATIIQNDCLQTRCVPQPSSSCLRNCEVGAANLYITCMRDGEARGGGNIPVCAARKQEFLRRCTGGCRGTVYPTPSNTPRGGPTRRP